MFPLPKTLIEELWNTILSYKKKKGYTVFERKCLLQYIYALVWALDKNKTLLQHEMTVLSLNRWGNPARGNMSARGNNVIFMRLFFKVKVTIGCDKSSWTFVLSLSCGYKDRRVEAELVFNKTGQWWFLVTHYERPQRESCTWQHHIVHDGVVVCIISHCGNLK